MNGPRNEEQLLEQIDGITSQLDELLLQTEELERTRRQFLDDLLEARVAAIERSYHFMNDEWHCAYCCGPMTQAGTGRLRVTCSDACRTNLARWRRWRRIDFADWVSMVAPPQLRPPPAAFVTAGGHE